MVVILQLCTEMMYLEAEHPERLYHERKRRYEEEDFLKELEYERMEREYLAR